MSLNFHNSSLLEGGVLIQKILDDVKGRIYWDWGEQGRHIIGTETFSRFQLDLLGLFNKVLGASNVVWGACQNPKTFGMRGTTESLL